MFKKKKKIRLVYITDQNTIRPVSKDGIRKILSKA